MDTQAIKTIVITKDNREAAICQAGTSVAKILQGIENGAENGIMDAIIETLLFGTDSEKYPA